MQVTDLLVEPMRMGLNGIYLISAPICKIDINLAIPNITIVDVRTERPLSISLNELEFQLLMRTFTQNFVEKTMVFDNE
ncbi:MAG: hypothetical protein JST59_00955 [Actinobacteria bacterium]|nr:hypothetical protein [Actinomycetota bacterium]